MREIEFTLEPRDVEAWYFHQVDRQRTSRTNYWAVALIVSGLLAVAADSVFANILVSLAAALIGFGIGWALGRASVRSYLRIAARERARVAPATQFGPHKLAIDAGGISEQGPASQHRYDWNAVQDISETDGYLFFMLADGSAYIVPKRAVMPGDSLEAFRAEALQEMRKRGG